ncbi:hypothetical protein CoNPh34_CDS0037 [Staphylococcus phage S-CoN_Ph34]|nr:hypothetical protein CoNPh34_CDS0037 [Staphylococcus phage S-CoN_Ph34]
MTNLNNILNKYSNGGSPQYDYDNEKERDFIKLAELPQDKKYTIEALFINTKGKFGNQGVIVIENYFVNLPNHLTEMIEEMRSDNEVTEAINNRELAFEIYEFTSKKYNRTSVSINIVASDNVEVDSKKSRKRAT